MYLAYDDVTHGKTDDTQYTAVKNSILKLIEATKQQNESFSVPRTEDGHPASVKECAVSKLVGLHKDMRTRILDGSKLPKSALEQYMKEVEIVAGARSKNKDKGKVGVFFFLRKNKSLLCSIGLLTNPLAERTHERSCTFSFT